MPAQRMMGNDHIKDGRRVYKKTLKLEVHVTDHCNLNCKGCDHFSPISKIGFLNIKQFEKDIEQINKIAGDYLEHLFLLGGEPLLNPDITSIIEISRKQLACPIYIVTNGILLTKMPVNFWVTCKANNIIISITDYPINLDYNAIMKLSEIYGVTVKIFKDVSGEKQLYHLPLDLDGKQDSKENYLHCWRPKYPILKEGRIYPCVIPANIYQFNCFFEKKLSITENDSVDIYAVADIDELLYELSKPIEFCKYCNIYGETFGHKFEISQKKIQEWL